MLKLIYFVFCLLFFTSITIAQLTYDFYISNNGQDSNSGKRAQLPKQTLAGAANALKSYAVANGSVTVGLASGSIFNEAFFPSYPIGVRTYNTINNTDFAILNGSDVFDTNWKLASGTTNTWQQDVTFQGFTGSGINNIGNYSYLCVFEIDRQLEKTAPFTARKLLQFVSSAVAVEATSGSFYEPVGKTNPVPVLIHTSDGSSPNNNTRYRYEVTVRDNAVDASKNIDNKFYNLWVRGYGAGVGLLPSGANTSYNKVIFGPGAGIHHVVAKNGVFNNCLFLPGAPSTSGGAVVFYDTQGFERHNKISNSIFLDIPTRVYAHTSNGTNYGSLKLERVFAFADGLEKGSFIGMNNTDTALVNEVYSEGLTNGYHLGSATTVEIKNSVFKDVASGISFQANPTNATINNVYIKSAGTGNVTGIGMQANTSLSLKNSIIYLKNTNNNASRVGSFVSGSGGKAAYINATSNIFICEVEPQNTLMTATVNTDLGIATSQDIWSNNVYVLLKGSNIFWSVTNKATTGGNTTTLFSFSEWKKQSGQDQNSLFLDLRKDPRGLKAIFLDPENGNYTLANTEEGNKIRALGAGMKTTLSCFLKKPSYEEAADMIKNDKFFAFNSCRNPCQKTSVKVTSSGISQTGEISICANDEVSFTGTGSYNENDHYYHQSDNTARYLWWFSNGEDASGNYLNTVTHKFTSDQQTGVRLQMVDANGCSFDTSFTVKVLAKPSKPSLGKDTSLCTGETMQLKAEDSQASNKYTWSNQAKGVTELPVTVAGEYWVQVENNFGCKASDTINIVNKTPLTIFLGNDTTICSSAPILLKPNSTGDIKSYSWNTGVDTDTLRISNAGTYIITAKNAGVCIVSDTINIANNPVNLITVRDTVICEASTYTFRLNVPASTTVTWNDGTTGYYHSIKAGTYSLVAVNNGCVKKDTFIVATKPLPVIKLRADTTICYGYSLPLAASYPRANYLWSTGSRDRVITVTNKGTYWVQANLNGCSYRDSINLNVQTCACNIKIPGVLTPDGDGINDVIRPKIMCIPTNFNWSIYSRYGQLVYNTKNYNSAWNGTLSGTPLPAGTYYYIITATTESAYNSKPVSGSITILR